MASKGGVMITGASTGIGEYCALGLDKLGYRVFAGVRKPEDGDRLKSEASGQLTPVVVDVTNEDQVRDAARTVADALGDEPLAALWNNAGITVNGPLEYVPLDEIRRQLEVNVVGQIGTTQAFLPLLRKSKGRIIITGSVGGFFVTPMMGPYCMSKFAMEAMADTLRSELRPFGIEVVLIEPGAIQSKIWEKGIGEAEAFIEQSPPEMMEHYGWLVNAMRKVAPQMEKGAKSPQAVLDAVVHALTASKPKTRYVMGGNARAQRWISRLPDRWQDALIAKTLRG